MDETAEYWRKKNTEIQNTTREQKQEQLKRHYLCFSVSVWAPRSMDQELLWVYEKGNSSWSDDSSLLQYLKPCHPICTELTLFWSNLEQITVAPNGSAGCLLQGGDKSLYAGSSGPAGFHPTIARLPADVWHAKHRLEIRRPVTVHLHVLYLMIQAREGPPHTRNTHADTHIVPWRVRTHKCGIRKAMHTLEYRQAHVYSISMAIYRNWESKRRKTVVNIRQWGLRMERKIWIKY